MVLYSKSVEFQTFRTQFLNESAKLEFFCEQFTYAANRQQHIISRIEFPRVHQFNSLLVLYYEFAWASK